MNRRRFIKSSAIGSGALLITVPLGCSYVKKRKQSNVVFQNLNAYLTIGSDNTIEITNPIPEIGQNVSTSLPMLVAEELDVDWKNIRVKQAKAAPDFGGSDQRAAGSNSVRIFWKPMREAGALVKVLLLKAAAEKWSVNPQDCYTKKGMIYNRLNRNSLTYGEVSSLAATYDIPKEIRLKSKSDFAIIGTNPKNKSIAGIVNGQTKFGFDIKVDGMLYAGIEKGPSYGATVNSFNREELIAINGISDAFVLPYHGEDVNRPYCREGVVVVGTSTWNVIKGRKALKIKWDLGNNTSESSEALHRQSQNLISQEGKFTVKNDGNFYGSIREKGVEIIESEYHVQPVVHVPMETVNCTVILDKDSCELWSTTQMPFVELNFIANFLKLPKENITMHIPRIGGAFGRRLGVDFTLEALKIAKQVKKPVQLFWTREDDISQSAFRPFSYHKMLAGVDKDKQGMVSWLHRQAGTSRYAFRPNRKPFESEFFPNHFPANLIPNFRQEYSLTESNLQRSLIRAPGNNALAFPVESFIDEIAYAVQKDPLKFRLELLGANREFMFDEEEGTVISTKRMRDVLQLAATKADWGKPLPEGTGMGVASYFTFDTYVAHIMEVSVRRETGSIEIRRVTSAIDCGQVVNPDGVEAQIEGSIHDALSVALYQEITVSNGLTDESNFDEYQVLRMKDAPRKIDIHIIDSEYPPTGVGEPPYPPVFPALCNAIYAACGVRIKRLPIGDQLKINGNENV